MSSEPSPVPDTARPGEPGEPGEAAAAAADTPPPDWWHRDHPTFTALTGFFTGLAYALIVPGVYAGVLGATTDVDTAQRLFPYVLLALAVPFGLVAAPRTRRFGLHMLLGLVATLLVVSGVTALVLWVLVTWF